jgi:preprotein translocase subunit SecF
METKKKIFIAISALLLIGGVITLVYKRKKKGGTTESGTTESGEVIELNKATTDTINIIKKVDALNKLNSTDDEIQHVGLMSTPQLAGKQAQSLRNATAKESKLFSLVQQYKLAEYQKGKTPQQLKDEAKQATSGRG